MGFVGQNETLRAELVWNCYSLSRNPNQPTIPQKEKLCLVFILRRYMDVLPVLDGLELFGFMQNILKSVQIKA